MKAVGLTLIWHVSCSECSEQKGGFAIVPRICFRICH